MRVINFRVEAQRADYTRDDYERETVAVTRIKQRAF